MKPSRKKKKKKKKNVERGIEPLTYKTVNGRVNKQLRRRAVFDAPKTTLYLRKLSTNIVACV